MCKGKDRNLPCIEHNQSLPMDISSHLGIILVKIGGIFEEKNHVTHKQNFAEVLVEENVAFKYLSF